MSALLLTVSQIFKTQQNERAFFTADLSKSGQPLHYIKASDQNGCEGNKHLTGSNVSSHFNDRYPPHTKTRMALNMAAKLEMIRCPYLYVSEIILKCAYLMI